MDSKRWTEMGLSQPVLGGILDLGFTTLTPVQASCIPLFLSKKDVAVEAVTGSGKTLAFVVPMFEILLRQKFRKLDVGAVIISPTRELACQTADVIDVFIQNVPEFSSVLLIGGVPVSADIQKMKEGGANIIIATPGRLADLFNYSEAIRLAACMKTLEVLILDEADKLLEMGFEKTINTILGYLPKQRQTGLFSATQTKEMEDLIRAGLRNPYCISVKEKGSDAIQRTPVALSNFYALCPEDEKFSILLSFLRSNSGCKCMVFFATCASVDYFSTLLKVLVKRVPVISIHGKMKKKRHKIFSDFKTYSSGVLLCTDVMARGVDIPDVDWVVQFDPPSSASSFVHRCGRTARTGKTGSALVLLQPNEDAFLTFLEVNQKVTLEKMTMPDTIDVVPKIRKMATKNRDIYEKGLRAFVSYIRFYTKHECDLLFRVKDLNLGKLAYGYGLLKLPKMPELKKVKAKDFEHEDMDYDGIPYLDKTREKQRQLKLQELKDNPKESYKVPHRKEKWLKKKKLLAKRQVKRKLRQKEDTAEDLEELERDARLVKKFKKGKISKEEFDAEFLPDIDS